MRFEHYTSNPDELDAFGDFIKKLANIRRATPPDTTDVFKEDGPAPSPEPPKQSAAVVKLPKRSRAEVTTVVEQIVETPEPAPVAAPAAAPAAEAKAYTKDDLRRLLVTLSTAKGASVVRRILDGFDAPNVSGLPEDKYAEFAAAVESEIAQ
jgi:hypothetical protein